MPTKEELKARQAELKALAEKEKAAQRQKLTEAFLKLKCDKEYELIKLNDNKLLDVWRPRLRKLKKTELLEDYELLKTSFEQALSKKESMIQVLESMLEKNDSEYDNAFDMHMFNIDKMLSFYRSRLDEVRENYGLERTKLLQKLDHERTMIQKYHEHSMEYLKAVTDGVNRRYEEMAADAQAELYVPHEELKTKAVEDTMMAREIIDQRMNEIWAGIQERLSIYETNMEPKRQEYMQLRKKDDVIIAINQDHLRRIKVLKEGLLMLDKKDNTFVKFIDNFLGELQAKWDHVKEQHNKMKAKYEEISKFGAAKIKSLVVVSSRVLEDLDRMKTLRQSVLKSISRARKHEREDEKVDPFMSKWGIPEDPDDVQIVENPATLMYFSRQDLPRSKKEGADMMTDVLKAKHVFTCECNPCHCEVEDEATTTAQTPVNAFLQENALLERFWIRANRADLERVCLLEKKKQLLNDNYRLRLALRNYMGGLDPDSHDVYQFSNDSVVKRSTPLSTYSGRESGYSSSSQESSNQDPGTGRKSVAGSLGKTKKILKTKPLEEGKYHPSINVIEGSWVYFTEQKHCASQPSSFSCRKAKQRYQHIVRQLVKEIEKREKIRRTMGVVP